MEEKAYFDNQLKVEAIWRLTHSDLAWKNDVLTAFYSQKTYL